MFYMMNEEGKLNKEVDGAVEGKRRGGTERVEGQKGLRGIKG